MDLPVEAFEALELALAFPAGAAFEELALAVTL